MLVGMNECDRLIEEMDDWIKELQPLNLSSCPWDLRRLHSYM